MKAYAAVLSADPPATLASRSRAARQQLEKASERASARAPATVRAWSAPLAETRRVPPAATRATHRKRRLRKRQRQRTSASRRAEHRRMRLRRLPSVASRRTRRPLRASRPVPRRRSRARWVQARYPQAARHRTRRRRVLVSHHHRTHPQQAPWAQQARPVYPTRMAVLRRRLLRQAERSRVSIRPERRS